MAASSEADGDREAFAAAVSRFDDRRPVLVVGHNDADGLAATAILVRALRETGRDVAHRIVGRGENPWSPEMRAELAAARPGGLVVTDLGVREGDVAPGVATVIVDHHVPTGTPGQAVVISGYGRDPIPTSSLLAFRCVAGLVGDPDALLWLAALGIVGDMAEGDGFPELAEAKRRVGITAIRDAVSLVNAARRSSTGDAGPALALLLDADGPKQVTAGTGPEAAALRAARDEVKVALDAAKRVGPKVRDGVALVQFGSPCQIHPLVAQAWRNRLRGEIVLAANTGFRPGWVHFAARSARDVDLIDFLARHAPAGADENYGSGHRRATGGALRAADWNAFVAGLGFPDGQVAA